MPTSINKKTLYRVGAALVTTAIFASLFMGKPLQEYLRDQNVQAVFFLTGMLLAALAVLFHGLNVRPDKRELAIWFGIAAVYVMFVFRLGAPERSHMIEYSILAILIHKYLLTPPSYSQSLTKTALLAITISSLIGVLDECIQIFLPHRVFDYYDIVFNIMVSTMAVITSMVLHWGKGFRGFG